MNDCLNIASKSFASRFLIGTGKFKSQQAMKEAIQRSGAQIVTVALRRIDLDSSEDNILHGIPEGTTIMVNTSGARNADEAIRIPAWPGKRGMATG